MYEIDQTSKDKLEEICDIRQPTLFEFDNQKIIESTNRAFVTNNYTAFDVKIRNVNDSDPNSDLYVPLPLHAAVKLFDEDKGSCYLSENNADFLNDTGVIKSFKYNDGFLRPHMVSNCNYDIMMGSLGVCTPFKYEINYRNFFLLTQGSAQIKLAPPKSIKYLYPQYDYENFEFKSPVNCWNPQPNYLADFDKIKCLEFTLLPGKTLYIPAYWWYSIQFGANTSISTMFYRTYMNNLAIAPYIGLHALQIQNVKRDVVKKVPYPLFKNPLFKNPLFKNPLFKNPLFKKVEQNMSVSEATVSEATVSEATVSEATVSEATVSEATTSAMTTSEANIREPEPFLANSIESVSVLSTTNL